MNIFMLGNGFDLHYSFPTKYINFLNTIKFLCENTDKQFENIASIFGEQTLQKRDKDIKRCYDRYKTYYSYVDVEQAVLKEIVLKAQNNTWFNFFCEEYCVDVGWIDFEKEIARVLERLSHIFRYIDNDEDCETAIFQEAGELDCTIQKTLRLFALGDFVKREEVPAKKEENIWLIASKRGREYFFFKTAYHNLDHSINKSKIISELAESLKELSSILSFYLHQFVEAAIPQLAKENKIRRDYLFRSQGVVVTFNYTKTYETLQCVYDSSANQKSEVYHIHGTTDSTFGIVLGINADKTDELAGLNTAFLPFKKYFQRVVFHTDDNYMKLIREAKASKYLIYSLYVFGHSLDETDKDAIKELFGIANTIVIFYHSSEALEQYVNNLVSIFGKHKFDQLRIDKKLDFISDKLIDDEDYLASIGAIPAENCPLR